MSLTSRDYDSCWLEATARFEKIKPDLMKFYEPQVEDALREALAQLSPEQAQAIALQEPDAFDEMSKFVGGV